MAEEDFYLLLNIDHMILDGTSMAVFFKEISAATKRCSMDMPPLLAPLAVQYADYAVWQHERVARRIARSATGLLEAAIRKLSFSLPKFPRIMGTRRANFARRALGEISFTQS